MLMMKGWTMLVGRSYGKRLPNAYLKKTVFGRVLECGCGPGFYTQQVALHAESGDGDGHLLRNAGVGEATSGKFGKHYLPGGRCRKHALLFREISDSPPRQYSEYRERSPGDSPGKLPRSAIRWIAHRRDLHGFRHGGQGKGEARSEVFYKKFGFPVALGVAELRTPKSCRRWSQRRASASSPLSARRSREGLISEGVQKIKRVGLCREG